MKQRKLNLWIPAKSRQNLGHQLKTFTVQYNRRQSKETQNWDKEINRRKLQKRHRKVKNRNESQRETSCGYISSIWSFKLADRELPITKFGFELSKQQFWDSIRLEVSGDEGNRHFSTFLGFQPQRLSLSQQVPAAVSCYEWTGKKKSLQWKDPTGTFLHLCCF